MYNASKANFVALINFQKRKQTPLSVVILYTLNKKTMIIPDKIPVDDSDDSGAEDH